MSAELERLDQWIAEARTELSRLEIAREVLLELSGQRPTAPHAGPQAGGVNGKGFTLRRVAEPAANAKAAPAKRMNREALRGKVLDALKAGPMASGDLVKRFGLKTKEQKQPLYQVMWQLKHDGQATKGDDERYKLVAAH